MAIRRCPYCKAIIDESQKYCNNCGTQLLFPQDETIEEDIKGEKIRDDDFKDAEPDEDEFEKSLVPSDEEAAREEIDLEEILEGSASFPDDAGRSDAGEAKPIQGEPVLKPLPKPRAAPKSKIPSRSRPARKPAPKPAAEPEPAPRASGEDETPPAEEPAEVPVAPSAVPIVDASPRIELPPLKDEEEEEEETEEREAAELDGISPGEPERPLRPVDEDELEAEDELEEVPDLEEAGEAERLEDAEETEDVEKTEEDEEEEEAVEKEEMTEEFQASGEESEGGEEGGEDDRTDDENTEEAGAESAGPERLNNEEEIRDEVETRGEIARLIAALEKKHKKDPLSREEKTIIAPLEDTSDLPAWADAARSDEDEDAGAEDDLGGTGRDGSALPGDTMDFEEEVMRDAGRAASRPTIGIPETLPKVEIPVLRGEDRDVDEIEAADAAAMEADEAESGDAEGVDEFGSESAPDFRPRRRLGFLGFLKAGIADLCFVALLWLAAVLPAAGILGVSLKILIGESAAPLALLYASLLFLYLFLFLFFLGETLGARLAAPRR
jgi:hypothetical protein